MLLHVGGLIWVPLWVQCESGGEHSPGCRVGEYLRAAQAGVGQRAHCGAGAPSHPQSATQGPSQVAGTWHSLAIAVSDISLLDAQSAP